MATVANFIFNKDEYSVDIRQKEGFEGLLKAFRKKGLTKDYFIQNIAPIFLFYGASIITVLSDRDNKLYSYEVQFKNENEFSTIINQLILTTV